MCALQVKRLTYIFLKMDSLDSDTAVFVVDDTVLALEVDRTMLSTANLLVFREMRER